MSPVPEDVSRIYNRVLEHAILDLRMRIRYDDDVTIAEVHDLLDAIHNIPHMLRDCDGWHASENIDADLARYDSKWIGAGNAERRKPLMDLLQQVRNGDFDDLK